jgi:hypothetical protein
MPTVGGVTASLPEYTIAKELDRMGLVYEFQTPMLGGREVKGGLVADFYLPNYSLIISVLGVYYHYELNKTAKDVIEATAIMSQGISTIFIDEDDALKNPHYYIEEALRGIDHSRLARR